MIKKIKFTENEQAIHNNTSQKDGLLLNTFVFLK